MLYENVFYMTARNKDVMTRTTVLNVVWTALISVFTVFPARSETVPAPSTLKANFRRVGLELSSTNVSHATEYENSPLSRLNADSQSVVKGVFDFMLEYNREDMRWDNGLFMEYARTKLKPEGEPSETNESADKILLSSSYAHKVWKLSGVNFGPMFNAEYQTEFTRNNDAPRAKIARMKGGMTLFDGKIIRDFYVAAVGEYDMTYSKHVSKFAGEVGWRLEYKPENRPNISFSTDGYYRRYFSYSRYIGTDLRYELSLTARMDASVTDTLSLGPYISYLRAHSRESSVAGANFMIGLSFSYKDLFSLK